MASGNYARKSVPREPIETESIVPLRARATRQLPETQVTAIAAEKGLVPTRQTKALRLVKPTTEVTPPKTRRVISAFVPHPLERHKPWMKTLVICIVCTIVFSAVLISAAVYQRPGDPQLVDFWGGKVYDVQVGGSLANTWQTSQPLAPKVPIPSQAGPYSVLGKPTISADFINQVLASYNSPAAGKGQTLYDLGVKYGIDPAFALAFFMHESTFGTAGEARLSLSLGNLRCIPNFKCQDGYAWFNSWEDGFEAWYRLIRNLYVAQWGLVTVDQIIPRYAPNSDNNNEAVYISSLKHYLDTWHAGILRP